MTDHYTEALRLIQATDREDDFYDMQVNLASARVHATLALAEQQRIANLIALGDDVLYDDTGWLYPDIMQALRIETQ